MLYVRLSWSFEDFDVNCLCDAYIMRPPNFKGGMTTAYLLPLETY